MPTIQTTLLSFFGEECWPYVLGDSFVVKALITHKKENGDYRDRIVIYLSNEKIYSIITNYFTTSGPCRWESAELCKDGRLVDSLSTVDHFSITALFTYLQKCSET